MSNYQLVRLCLIVFVALIKDGEPQSTINMNITTKMLMTTNNVSLQNQTQQTTKQQNLTGLTIFSNVTKINAVGNMTYTTSLINNSNLSVQNLSQLPIQTTQTIIPLLSSIRSNLTVLITQNQTTTTPQQQNLNQTTRIFVTNITNPSNINLTPIQLLNQSSKIPIQTNQLSLSTVAQYTSLGPSLSSPKVNNSIQSSFGTLPSLVSLSNQPILQNHTFQQTQTLRPNPTSFLQVNNSNPYFSAFVTTQRFFENSSTIKPFQQLSWMIPSFSTNSSVIPSFTVNYNSTKQSVIITIATTPKPIYIQIQDLFRQPAIDPIFYQLFLFSSPPQLQWTNNDLIFVKTYFTDNEVKQTKLKSIYL